MRANLFRRVLVLLMLSTSFVSCQRELPIATESQNSLYRETIENYLSQRSPITPEETQTVDSITYVPFKERDKVITYAAVQIVHMV